MTSFIPTAQVATDAGISGAEIDRYQAIEQRYGTGLLPARTWASEMSHPKPDLMLMVDEGLMPSQAITWLYYHQLFRAQP